MKTIIFPVIAVAVVILVPGCRQVVDDGATEREKILVLEQELATLQKKQQEMVPLNEIFDSATRNQVNHKLVMRYLELIEPPANASPEEVRQYIAKLARLSNVPVQNHKELIAAITVRVKALGREYLPDLLPYADPGNMRQVVAAIAQKEDKEIVREFALRQTTGSSIACDIFLKYADRSDKDTLLILLKRYPGVIATISMLELEKEALPIVKQKLLTGERFSPYKLFLRVAMDNIEESERPEFFRNVWRSLRVGSRNDLWGTWFVAAEITPYGAVGAFHFMMQNRNFYQNDKGKQRQALQVTEFDKIEDMESWYDANKDNLVFDPDKKIYKVAK